MVFRGSAVPTDDRTKDMIRDIAHDTKVWILNEADQKAAERGYWVDLEEAYRVIEWIESHCRLYEGDRAGQLIELMPYHVSFCVRLFGWRRWSVRLERWVRRFRRAGMWAAKKNGKSPFLAALELYMCIADGEQGQKIYTAAKDGDQARITQLQAYKMVEQSPELADECKLYANTLTIIHIPTNSFIKALSSGSERNKQAKEGLNGSVFWDEMHVVDETLVNRVSRAGISRAEPLDVCVSTAGNELECAGRRRFEYGRQVNNGERNDLQYLHVEYSVPDNVTDEQLISDPLPYLKQANPAWGITIDEEEILNDLEQSQDDPAQLSLFWQYRGNRWVSSANAWLDMQGWAAGKRDYHYRELGPEFEGRECFAGLDLSRVRDMTSFVLLFPWPEDHPDAVRTWPMFWLPEKTAKKRDKVYPFMSWAQAGYLRLTEGARIGYDQVKKDIRDVVRGRKLKLLEISYDPHIANELTQALVEGDVSRTGDMLEEGLGCERSEFRQYAAEYAGPTKEYEQMVQNGLLLHPDNRVLTWQASLCEVHTDVNQYIRPIKPNTRQTGKSIDGVAASIMGLRPLLAHRAQKFLY